MLSTLVNGLLRYSDASCLLGSQESTRARRKMGVLPGAEVCLETFADKLWGFLGEAIGTRTCEGLLYELSFHKHLSIPLSSLSLFLRIEYFPEHLHGRNV